VRAERIVTRRRIQDEIDAYNALVPDHGQLSRRCSSRSPASRRCRPPGPHRRQPFPGHRRRRVVPDAGAPRAPARFEGGTAGEKLAAVQYLRFAIQQEARRRCRRGAAGALTVDAPAYQARQASPDDVRNRAAATTWRPDSPSNPLFP
jgi:hypothetical protein